MKSINTVSEKAVKPVRIVGIAELKANVEYIVDTPLSPSPVRCRCLGNYGAGDGEKVYMANANTTETPESMAEKFANNQMPNCFVIWDYMLVSGYHVSLAP